MFQCENGLIHFVFANEDSYCLPNLCHLSFHNWLYYQLCKDGYTNIVLCSGNNPFCFTAYESGAYTLVQEVTRAGLLKKMMKITGIQPGQSGHQSITKKLSASEFGAACRKMLQQNTKTALVMPLECFYSLFEGTGDFTEKLIQDNLHFKYNGNILLLTSTLSVKDSYRILIDPQGPFAVQYGNKSLCPNLRSMILSTHRIPVYEHMQSTMYGQVHFLNRFTAAALRTVLESVVLCNPEIWLSYQELDTMAAYLQLWFSSPELQKHRPLPLQDNPLHKFMILENDLKKLRVFNQVYRAAMEYREYIPVKQNIPEVCLLSDNSVSSLLENMCLSAELEDEVLDQLLLLKKYFSIPWNHAWPEDVMATVMDCFYILKDIVSTHKCNQAAQAVRFMCEYGRISNMENMGRIYNLMEGDLEIRRKHIDIDEKKQLAKEQIGRMEEKISVLSEELSEEKPEMGDPRFLRIYDLRKNREALQKVISSQEIFLTAIAGKRESIESTLKAGDFTLEKVQQEDYQLIRAQLEKNEAALEDMVRQTNEVHKMMDQNEEEQLQQMAHTKVVIEYGKENSDAILEKLKSQFL